MTGPTYRTQYNLGIGSFPKAVKPKKLSSTYEVIFEAILQKKPLTMLADHVNLPSLRTQFNRWRRKFPEALRLEDYVVDISEVPDSQPARVSIFLRLKQTVKQLDYIIDEPVTALIESTAHGIHENLLPILDEDS